jgi:hypothetical protein
LPDYDHSVPNGTSPTRLSIQKMIRPNGAVKTGIPNQMTNRISEQIICRPFRAGAMMWIYPGLKPRAESYHPFGISPRRDKLNKTMLGAVRPKRQTPSRHSRFHIREIQFRVLGDRIWGQGLLLKIETTQHIICSPIAVGQRRKLKARFDQL